MRKITSTVIIGVIFCFCEFSLFFQTVTGREYEACNLITEFIEVHKLPLEDSIGMTCIANSMSELKTTHAQTDTSTRKRVFGMFGINEGAACKFGTPGFCDVTCDKFLDDDITDDLECLQKILKKTTKRPQAFIDCETYDWKNLMQDCSNVIKKFTKRETSTSNFFKLKDFEIINDEISEKTTIERPGPPAISKDYDEGEGDSEEAPNKTNFQPEYVTDEPPRPFNTRKTKKIKNKKPGNMKDGRRKKQKKPRTPPNPITSVIKTPILPMEFHVIPGPSVSVPITSINQPIPDVPIDPPPSLNRMFGFMGSREYLPPYAAQTDPDGRSKKYDIKLDRPASKITVHVTYA